jgi:predicted DsbA family dithiol-disulfide isomerase
VRIAELQQEFDLDCQYRPFPLHPETPDAGLTLDELFGGRIDVAAAMARLHQVAGSLGLPLGERTRTYNSRKAQELGLWAESQGAYARWIDSVYRAYFVDGVNLAQTAELLKIVAGCNLNTAEAARVLEERRYAAELDRLWQQALNQGIRAVPTLRCAGRELVGFQSLEACRQLLTG